ncbi:MAG: Flp pilus assembly protein CpaB [Acetobacteraceae bacterium]|nr:Flp pilus assembly protein CpaB [Acetobacteraceae bacterium]
MLLRVLIIFSLLLSATGLGVVGIQLLTPAAPPAPTTIAEAPPPPPARVKVMVAARALTLGSLLKDDDLTVRELPAEAVPEGAMELSDEVRMELRGALLRRYLDPNTPVLRGDVLRPRDRGFLAAVLRPGTRAIAVGVDVVTGTAGLIWPGDQVDLILTQTFDAAPVSRRVVGETVLSDVRVIAVDQQISHGASSSESGLGRVARTVTLEVTPEQAERVAVATRLGRIDLTVRAIDLDGPATAGWEPETSRNSLFGADVSPALARSAVSPGARMRVIQGGEQQEVNFR